MDVRQAVLAQIDAESAPLVALSPDLHAHPELAFEEHESVRRLLGYLRRHQGIHDRGRNRRAADRLSRLGRAASGPTIGIVCEYDALAGLGHGCGHNLIATAAVAVLAGLAPQAATLSGRVIVIGSPAEEGKGGKLDPGASAAPTTGWPRCCRPTPRDRHRLSGPTIGMARSTSRSGVGRRTSAARTTAGINALDALMQLFNAMNAMRQQVRDGCRLYGIITRGGDAVNTIPDHTAAEIGVRAPDEDYLRELLERVEACARGAATADGVHGWRSSGRRSRTIRRCGSTGRSAGSLGDTLSSLGEPVEDFPPGL